MATGILVRDDVLCNLLALLDAGRRLVCLDRRIAARVESIPFEPDQRSDLRREAPSVAFSLLLLIEGPR